jgi:hypothetical protein
MLHHFWLICGLWCGAGNGLLIWARRRKYVELGLLTEEEVTGFAKGTILWILVPCSVLWALQLSIANDVGPMYPKWPDPQRMLAVGLQVLVWLALAFWVFVGRGAHTLSAFFSVGSRAPAFLYSPGAMRVGTIVTIIVSGVASLRAYA